MKATNYETYRKTQIESGQAYQDFVVDCCYRILNMPISCYSSKLYQQNVGESINGVEIKNDRKFKESGNLYVEIAEKARPRAGDYAQSGINRGDNTWLYLIGDFDTIYVFAKSMLVGMSKSPKYRHVENGTKTSVGFLLPVTDAVKYAAVVMTPNASEKIAKCQHDMHRLGFESFRTMIEGNASQMMLNLFDDEGTN